MHPFAQRLYRFRGTLALIFFCAGFFIFTPAVVYAADFVLRDDAAGGDCAAALGTWNAATKTCTLGHDVYGSVAVAGSGITLDGGVFAIAGSSQTGSGIEIREVNKPLERNTIRNVTIRGWQHGADLYRAYQTKFEQVRLENNGTGIQVSDTPGLILKEVRIVGNGIGLNTVNSFSGLALENVAFAGNKRGLALNINTAFPGLSIGRSNTLNGRPIVYFEGETGTVHENLGEIGALYCVRCTGVRMSGVTVEGGDGPNGTGISFWYSDDNEVFDAAIGGVKTGTSLIASSRNFFHDVTFRIANADPDQGVAVGVAVNPFTLSHNRFLDNNFLESGTATLPFKTRNLNFTSGSEFYTSSPLRGNYLSRFDTSAEGCTDADANHRCDGSLLVNEGGPSLTEVRHAWTAENAWQTPDEPRCCSSVAFIPGIQASRLYEEGVFFENRLWEPNRHADVRKLLLNDSGKSINPDVYTRDVIDEAFGLNIYKKFLQSLDERVAEGIIGEARVLPYDWRKSIADVVSEPVMLPNSETYRMADTIEAMAANSQTGKVTLVAHSNGGLVAKELVRVLEAAGKAGLIDTLILVASPQTGTPKALASLLHGDFQEIPGKVVRGIVLDKSLAREFGEDMPGAYTLMPSQKYFTDVADPVAVFDESVVSITDPGWVEKLSGVDVASRYSLNAFVRGNLGSRTEPASGDTDTPNVLNTVLLEEASALQDRYDAWIAPAHIRVVQIAGWGLETLKGIRYVSRTAMECAQDTFVCIPTHKLDREPIFTADGDGTVVIPSAVAMNNVETYYVDLDGHNEQLGGLRRNRNHADVLEAEDTQALLADIFSKNEVRLSSIITTEKPPVESRRSRLRFSVHSPVAIGIYDASGAHTGLVSNMNPDSDLQFLEEDIPNSYYFEFGEGKYAGADASASTTVRLTGTGFGTFTFRVESVSSETVVSSLSFVDIPVVPGAVATFITDGFTNETSLLVDMDADGGIDAEVQAGEGLAARELIGLLRGTVRILTLAEKGRAKMDRAIDKFERELKKEYKGSVEEKKVELSFNNFGKLVERFQKKGILEQAEAQQLFHIVAMLNG